MRWIKLAKLTWLELWQSHVYKSLLVLSLLSPGLAIVMGSLFMVDIGKVYIDTIAAFSQLIAIMFLIFMVVGLLSKDIFDRVCYILLTPPMTRFDYFFGRFLGFMLAFLALLLVLFVASLVIGLLYLGAKPSFYQSGFSGFLLAQLMFFYFFQYIAVLGVIFFIISWSSGAAEAMLFTVALLIFTWVFPPVLQAMQNPDVLRATPNIVMMLLEWVYEIIPHLQGGDISLALAHGETIQVQQGLLYVTEHMVYSVLFFTLGFIFFKRRDL